MKKVLFISSQPFFQWRGSPIRTGFDVRALSELGYEVDFLTLPIGEDREIKGVKIIRVPNIFLARRVAIGPSLLKAAFDVLLFFKGLRLALRNKYVVIHAVEDAGAFSVAIAGLSGSRLVFEKHSDPSSYKKGFFRNIVMFIYGKVESFTIRHSDAVIGTGMGLVEQARLIAGETVKAHHIFDIPSSLVEASKERTDVLRSSLKQNDDELLVTFVGSFALYQGVDLMFEAFENVHKKNGKARLVIIGGTSNEISKRKKTFEEKGAGGAVTFLGKIPPDDLPDYLCASDILLSPRTQGVNTPLKLLDYMKAAKAIVATDTEANRLILDKETAVLTESTPLAFAEGICSLLNDGVRRIKLGDNARRSIDEKYNFLEFKKRVQECYDGVLDADNS